MYKEITWRQVYNQIEVSKKKLRQSQIVENFGEKEVRRLKEKFDYNSRIYGSQKDRDIMKLIDLFDDWCQN